MGEAENFLAFEYLVRHLRPVDTDSLPEETSRFNSKQMTRGGISKNYRHPRKMSEVNKMETSEETLPALAKEQIVVTKDTRVPLIGLQLIMVALLCVIAFKEQSAPQLCKKVSIWVNACLIKLSIMVALQILQVQNESKTPRDPESVS